MLKILAMVFVFFASYAQASEVPPCNPGTDTYGRTWKLGLTTEKPGEVRIISHCMHVGPEDLTSLHPTEAAAVAGWTKKIKDLDLSRSVYRYYFIVENDHGVTLQVGLSEWKVSHALHLAVLGNGIQVPPCMAVVVQFLSPGPPKAETSYLELSVPDKKGVWSRADQTRPMSIHVSSSSHFVRGEMRVHKLPKRDATSAACK